MRPLLALVALLAVMRQGTADPEIHLIPAGYAGEVTIVFHSVNGEPLDVEDGARVYRIPASGILFTQLSPNEGLSPAQKFFLVSGNGERRPITGYWASQVHDTPENRAHPDVEIFNPTRGYMQSAEHRPCPVEYEQYFVGTRAQLLDRGDDHRHRVYKYLHDTFKCP
jgi:hypothetical protein